MSDDLTRAGGLQAVPQVARETMKPQPHPAPWSKSILAVLSEHAQEFRGCRVLDPFCGVGVERLRQALALPLGMVVGTDLEPEWAIADRFQVQANALHLPFAPGTFQAAITSVVYGNRTSDHHNATEKCRACGGLGQVASLVCARCNGAGRNAYRRITYKHYIGHDLHPDNAGAMQWGPKYRLLHERAWPEILRCVRPAPGQRPDPRRRIILNISDHERKQVIQEVTKFHVDTLVDLGCEAPEVLSEVATPRMKFGANREARVPFESVLSFRV